ncbi:MAG: helix-turn-helix domain-containing protein [Actinoallomurus sp.]
MQTRRSGPSWPRPPRYSPSLLTPLDDNPALLETLQTFMRTPAATAEPSPPGCTCTHNSVDYRLRRVQQLTGLDPSALDGAQRIAAALAARRAARSRIS